MSCSLSRGTAGSTLRQVPGAPGTNRGTPHAAQLSPALLVASLLPTATEAQAAVQELNAFCSSSH